MRGDWQPPSAFLDASVQRISGPHSSRTRARCGACSGNYARGLRKMLKQFGICAGRHEQSALDVTTPQATDSRATGTGEAGEGPRAVAAGDPGRRKVAVLRSFTATTPEEIIGHDPTAELRAAAQARNKLATRPLARRGQAAGAAAAFRACTPSRAANARYPRALELSTVLRPEGVRRLDRARGRADGTEDGSACARTERAARSRRAV